MSLLLIALLAAAPAAAPAPMVAAVELRLPSGSEPSLLKDAPELVAVRKGQRLGPRAVRRSLERLFATGRFSDVVVRAVDGPDGVTVVFELTPTRRIVFVRFSGNRVLQTAQLQEAARLSKDDEYTPERVEEAVASVQKAYFRRGYRQAQVIAGLEELAEGLEISLEVTEGSATRVVGLTAGGAPGLAMPRILEALGLHPGDVLDEQVLEEGLGRLRAVYRQERFYRAKVGEPEIRTASAGALVELPVDAGPRFELRFAGNRSFPDEVLQKVLAYDGQEPLERSLQDRLSRRLESFYRYKGFFDVSVRPVEVLGSGARRAVVRFWVEEGRPLFVRTVEFAGNRAIPGAELRRLLAEVVRSRTLGDGNEAQKVDDPLQLEGRTKKVAYADAPAPDPESVYVEAAYREAVESIVELYRQRGFLSAQVELSEVRLSVDEGAAAVHFSIDEGPRSLIGQIRLEGAPEGFVAPGSGLKTGSTFSHQAAEEYRLAVSRALSRQGYLFAHVETAPEQLDDPQSVLLAYRIAPGPKVRVGKVVLQGLLRTDEKVVRANLLLKEGEVLDPEALYGTQRNLAQLGVFRTVTVRIMSPELAEPIKDVLVEAKELPRLAGEIGGGYFIAEGPRLVIDWALPNALGWGLNVSGRGKLHYFGASGPVLSGQADTRDADGEELGFAELLGGRQTLSIESHGQLPPGMGARMDMVAERVHRRYFRFTRVSGAPGFDWETTTALPGIDWARLRTGLGLQVELAHVRVAQVGGAGQLLTDLASSEQERLRFEPGIFTLLSARVGPTFDLRDDPVNPRRGVLLQLSAEQTTGLLAQDVEGNSFPIQTLKLSGALSGYVPLGRHVVLALSGRGGRIFPLDPASKTIPPYRFYLGGASSMRGFREDGVIPADRRSDVESEVRSCQALANRFGCSEAAKVLLAGEEIPSEGGELFTLAKAELRFPVVGPFDLGVFFETGNLWLSPARFEWFDHRYVAGAGLRYVTPIGPLALDLGVNLLPDVALNEPAVNLHFNIGLF